MDVDTGEVTVALQHAYSGLLRAVELERRRPDDAVDIAGVVAEIHELRTMMSAAAQMMRSFDLARYKDRVAWGPNGRPDDLADVTPAQVIVDADADLSAAYDQLERAAGSLTSARRRLATIR